MSSIYSFYKRGSYFSVLGMEDHSQVTSVPALEAQNLGGSQVRPSGYCEVLGTKGLGTLEAAMSI